MLFTRSERIESEFEKRSGLFIRTKDENTTTLQTIGPSILISQLNIEGTSREKADYLSRLLTDDVLHLQETHF